MGNGWFGLVKHTGNKDIRMVTRQGLLRITGACWLKSLVRVDSCREAKLLSLIEDGEAF